MNELAKFFSGDLKCNIFVKISHEIIISISVRQGENFQVHNER